ncbi:hypothetical protein [Streptomyces sp. BA2]|uniref:hypothetical protein n=1 Tax=Streptomyces sp. BA2 TaxID=436595 RepID=UPI001323F6ED|nr:hypothetical protein [Streptomyces sp. BA2]MWA14006.1 hypothetical protein [Streptomyces sp. BA2]
MLTLLLPLHAVVLMAMSSVVLVLVPRARQLVLRARRLRRLCRIRVVHRGAI